MKINEIPEKVYIHKSQYWGLMANDKNITKKGIEYTRTDALIEKVEEYIYKQLNEGCIECGNMEKFIEDMKKYMEEQV